MAITLTLTPAQTTRVRAAAKEVGYPETDAGVQQWIVDWLKDSVRSIERRRAEAQVPPVADF